VGKVRVGPILLGRNRPPASSQVMKDWQVTVEALVAKRPPCG
jgi:hypothetical protein